MRIKRIGLAIALIWPLLVSAKGDAYGPPLASECNTSAQLSLVAVIRDPSEVQRLYVANSGDTGHKVLAFYSTGPDGRQVLVLPPLRGQNDEETMRQWGHELAHILCGRFHGDEAAY